MGMNRRSGYIALIVSALLMITPLPVFAETEAVTEEVLSSQEEAVTEDLLPETEAASEDVSEETSTEPVTQTPAQTLPEAVQTERATETVQETLPETAAVIIPAEEAALSFSEVSCGIVQVMIGYLFADGSYDIWETYPGAAVDEKTVVTAGEIAYTGEADEALLAVIREKTPGYASVGIDLSDAREAAKHLVYRVYTGGNFLLPASREAVSDGILVLSVSGTLPEAATLSEEALSYGTQAFAVGFIKEVQDDGRLCDGKEVLEQTITIKETSADGSHIFDTASAGAFTGGPVMTFAGGLAGIVTSCENGEGLIAPASVIKRVLGSAGRQMTETVKEALDVTPLDEAIADAASHPERNYTKDSYTAFRQAMTDVITERAKLLEEGRMTQEDVQRLTGAVKEAEGLLKGKKSGRIFWISAAAAAGVLVIWGALRLLFGKGIRKETARRKGNGKAPDGYLGAFLEKVKVLREDLGVKNEKRLQERAHKEAESEMRRKREEKAAVREKAPYDLPLPDDYGTEDFSEEGTVLLASPSARLLDSGTGEEVVVSHFPFIVGSSPSRADFVIDGNRSVSRVQFMIDYDSEKDLFTVTDPGSTNGTRVSGRTLEKGRPYPLRDGAEITFAGERVRFFREEEDA